MTELTDEQINKKIHELMGMCWLEPIPEDHYCHDKCGCHIVSTDFTASWEAFGILWEWLQKHEQWEEFADAYGSRAGYLVQGHGAKYAYSFPTGIISPAALPRAVVKFFEVKP